MIGRSWRSLLTDLGCERAQKCVSVGVPDNYWDAEPRYIGESFRRALITINVFRYNGEKIHIHEIRDDPGLYAGSFFFCAVV
jgi:hypothetical protein